MKNITYDTCFDFFAKQDFTELVSQIHHEILDLTEHGIKIFLLKNKKKYFPFFFVQRYNNLLNKNNVDSLFKQLSEKSKDLRIDLNCESFFFNDLPLNVTTIFFPHSQYIYDFFQLTHEKCDKKLIQNIYNNFGQYCKNNFIDHSLLHVSFQDKQNKIFNYIKTEKLEKFCTQDYLSDDFTEEKFDEIFNNIAYPKENKKIIGYCDFDFYPFIFGNHFVVEDVAGDNLFICQHDDEKNYTWYQIKGKNDIFENGVLHDLAYDTNYYLKYHCENSLIDINKIYSVKNDECDFFTHRFESIESINDIIYKGMIENRYFEPIQYLFNFSDLVFNHTIQKEHYHIVERSLEKLLTTMIIVDEKYTYEDASPINSNFFSLAKNEKDLSYFLTPFKNIDIFSKLNINHISEIELFINKLQMENQNRPSYNEFIQKIKIPLINRKKELLENHINDTNNFSKSLNPTKI